MRIIGIDLGLETTGYGIIDSIIDTDSGDCRFIDAGTVRTNRKERMEHRLKTIYEELDRIFEDFSPDIVVIEDLYSHYRHPRTAIIMGHARGIVYLLAGVKEIPVISYSSTKVKSSIVGYGRAGKAQVRKMVKGMLNLPEVPAPDDVSDALAVALCHANAVRLRLNQSSSRDR